MSTKNSPTPTKKKPRVETQGFSPSPRPIGVGLGVGVAGRVGSTQLCHTHCSPHADHQQHTQSFPTGGVQIQSTGDLEKLSMKSRSSSHSQPMTTSTRRIEHQVGHQKHLSDIAHRRSLELEINNNDLLKGAHCHKGPRNMDLDRGEGVLTRSAFQREQLQHAQLETQRQRSRSQTSTQPTQIPVARKSSDHYRVVLSKRGLLVKDTLGAGSYSKVKLAQSVKPSGDFNRYPSQVAVKIIDRAKAPKDFQEKFLPRELEIWPKLSHPNIVKMIDYFPESQCVYMILEFCEGGDALRFIQNSGAVSDVTTGRIWVRQVADAVRYLHDIQITHRDLKLENMLIDRNNNIKLCDFGFVKANCKSNLSRTFCGSKSYAAPEILKGEPYEPKKADVWAIGVISFILVTGRMPFDESKGNTSLLDEHTRLELQWPTGKKGVSSQCKALTVYCLTFLWSDRPDIHEVLAHPWFNNWNPVNTLK